MASFLDYYKTVLDRVSFYPELFAKEYQKAKRDLHTSEIGNLNSWIRSRGLESMVTEATKQAVEN